MQRIVCFVFFFSVLFCVSNDSQADVMFKISNSHVQAKIFFHIYHVCDQVHHLPCYEADAISPRLRQLIPKVGTLCENAQLR